MAQRNFTLNLRDNTFSLLYKNHPRTLIRDEDSRFDPELSPAIAYMHNVMPSIEGLDSIGFISRANAISGITDFTDVRVIYCSAKTRKYMGITSSGKIYILNTGATSWTDISFTSPVAASDITTGRVNGITYIYFKQVGCYLYNGTTETLDSVTLTGLTASEILGIAASSGYLIAYDETTLVWSSLITATDFTPSEVTGSSSGTAIGLGGAIKFVLSNSLGLMIYTDSNVIAGVYTGNVQYPFRLKEVDNSRGATDLDYVAYEANSTEHFAYTTGGFQSLNSREALVILPEVTNFLAGKEFEDFDETTKIFSYTTVTNLKKKIKFIASRYLVISYGITQFTHALIYDTAIKRLGKIKLTHVDCFEYIANQSNPARESIAFALNTGEIQTLNFSQTNTTSDGVLILGKLQYTRNKMMVLQEIEAENIPLAATVEVTDLYSLDGKNTANADTTLLEAAANIRRYGIRQSAINHSILFVGRFNLNSVFITYTLGGNR